MIKIKQIKSHASIPVYVGIELATDNLRGAIQKYLQEYCDHEPELSITGSGDEHRKCYKCGLEEIRESDWNLSDVV